MSLPELQQNPLVQRVIDIFDTDGNGEVDFKEFIEGLSQVNRYLTRGDYFVLVKQTKGGNYNCRDLHQSKC